MTLCNGINFVQVYCRHPALVRKKNVAIVDESFEFHNSLTLRDATEHAYKLLKLGDYRLFNSSLQDGVTFKLILGPGPDSHDITIEPDQ